MELELSNSIINKIRADTKYKYDGNYFNYNTFYNCDTSSINFKIKSKINDISDDGVINAIIFVDGFDENNQKYFKNLNEYISYLTVKAMSLDYKIKTDLDDFMNNLFDDDSVIHRY